MGVEQDNEKNKEQLDILEDLREQGTREIWQLLLFEQSRTRCPGITRQYCVRVIPKFSPQLILT